MPKRDREQEQQPAANRYHPVTGQYLGNMPYQKPTINGVGGGEEWGGKTGERNATGFYERGLGKKWP